tara:strand:+ start:804 stop:1046 length:243 start_codon:yes stop_codon:yes gene_type:complete
MSGSFDEGYSDAIRCCFASHPPLPVLLLDHLACQYLATSTSHVAHKKWHCCCATTGGNLAPASQSSRNQEKQQVEQQRHM